MNFSILKYCGFGSHLNGTEKYLFEDRLGVFQYGLLSHPAKLFYGVGCALEE